VRTEPLLGAGSSRRGQATWLAPGAVPGGSQLRDSAGFAPASLTRGRPRHRSPVTPRSRRSDRPPEVPTTDLSGYEPNVEAIAAYEPDLVVISGGPDDLVSGLEAVGAEVLMLPAATTLDDTYDQLEQLGEATGHEDEAADVAAGIEADIADLVAQVPAAPAEPPTYYHELDDQLYSVTSETFIGQLYGLAGLQSVADAADPNGDLGGYPQLSAEYLVDADPDFVFLADTECCAQDATTFAARPGFGDLTAVTQDHVVLMSDDIASRWGPRVVDFLRTVIEATAPAT